MSIISVESVQKLKRIDVSSLSDGQLVFIEGYYESNDQGHQTVRWEATSSETPDDGFIFTPTLSEKEEADIKNGDKVRPPGRFIAVEQQQIHVMRWGCRGDAATTGDHQAIAQGTDDTERLQAAIDAGVQRGIPISLPSKSFKVTDTLWITGSDSARKAGFVHATFQGESKGSGENLGSTRIVSEIKDKPILAIQFARGVVIKNITVKGFNMAPREATDERITLSRDAYVSPGYKVDKYAPQCGIAIDPTNGPEPGNPYKIGSYPYLNKPKQGSAFIDFLDVNVLDCVVGVLVCPGIKTEQGDNLSFHRCDVSGCLDAMAFCCSQERPSSDIVSFNAGQFHTLFDSVSYGEGSGSIPAIFGATTGFGCRLFKANPRTSINVQSLYCELQGSLGLFGLGVSPINSPVNFIGCKFSFGHSKMDYRNTPPMICKSELPINFVGCTFAQYWKEEVTNALYNFGGAGGFVFQSCLFASAKTDASITGRGIHVAKWSRDDGVSVHSEFQNCRTNRSERLGMFGTYQSGDLNTPIVYAHPGDSLLRVDGELCQYLPGNVDSNGKRLNDHVVASAIVEIEKEKHRAFSDSDGNLKWLEDDAFWTIKPKNTQDIYLFQAGDYLMGSAKYQDSSQNWDTLPIFYVEQVLLQRSFIVVRQLFSSTLTQKLVRPAKGNRIEILLSDEWAPLRPILAKADIGSHTIEIKPENFSKHQLPLKKGDWLKSPILSEHTRVEDIDVVHTKDKVEFVSMKVTLNKPTKAGTNNDYTAKIYWGSIAKI